VQPEAKGVDHTPFRELGSRNEVETREVREAE
jgi:hypothetical protein